MNLQPIDILKKNDILTMWDKSTFIVDDGLVGKSVAWTGCKYAERNEIVKKYKIIYADPPWHFQSKELQKYNGIRFTSMDKHYITQNKNWIKELPIKNITDKDCALFLWTTDAHLKEAIETIEAWGFKYITIAFIWEKKTKTGKTVANLGAWTMKNYEICLLGTKGTMLKYKQKNNIYQKVEAERTKHSKKPEQVRKNIVSLFGDLLRIELFARQKTEGWDVWGNEVESDIEITTDFKKENSCQ